MEEADLEGLIINTADRWRVLLRSISLKHLDPCEVSRPFPCRNDVVFARLFFASHLWRKLVCATMGSDLIPNKAEIPVGNSHK